MIRKRLVLLGICVVVLSLFLTSCGSDDKKDESSSKKSSSNSSSKGSSGSSNSSFTNKVKAACESVDKTVFDEITNSYTQEGGTAAFDDAIQAAEDELDKAIAKFDDIDPPAKYEEDWDTLVDDFSAIRDAYPEFADALRRISELTETMKSGDVAAISNAQAEMEAITEDVTALSEDLSQRSKEISQISTRLGIDDVCDLES